MHREMVMAAHKVVTHDEWLAARRKHLAKEKEFTRLRDQLSRERRELPWEPVGKEYAFEGGGGRQTLADTFEGRSQLVIYHAMFNPETAGPHTTWTTDAPCFVCSFWMDNFNGITVHLNHRDITMAAVSRAPFPKLAAYKKRRGGTFPWLSSVGGDFNFACHAPSDMNSTELNIVCRTARISPSVLVNVSAIRATNAPGGSSATKRCASFLEMNFAVDG